MQAEKAMNRQSALKMGAATAAAPAGAAGAAAGGQGAFTSSALAGLTWLASRMTTGSAGRAPPWSGAGPVPVGEEGIAATPLRPVGFVRFGDRRIEAVAEHGMIEAGTAVTVAESGPARIVVRARG